MIKNKRQAGFTIIELIIVMAALSVLLLGVLYAMLQAGKLYDKGVTNRSVNQMSRDVSDMLRRDFASVHPSEVLFVITGNGTKMSGRLCLGTVSYVWNTADMLSLTPDSGIRLSDGKPAVFVRAADVGQHYCSPAGGPYPMQLAAGSASMPVTNVLNTNGKEFAVYSLSVSKLAESGKQGLFRIAMTLGTNEKDTTQIDASSGSVQCKPPIDNSSNFTYCSVVDVDLIVRSGGKQ